MKVLRDPEWMQAVGERLIKARLALGKSQAAMARSIGISAQRLSNYETGFRPLDTEVAVAIADKYGVTLDYVYRGDVGTLPVKLAEKIAPIELPPGALRN